MMYMYNLSPNAWEDQRSRQGDKLVINQLITIIYIPIRGWMKEGYWVITKLSPSRDGPCNYCQLASCKHGSHYWFPDASKEINMF